jgi:hypothetical protein
MNKTGYTEQTPTSCSQLGPVSSSLMRALVSKLLQTDAGDVVRLKSSPASVDEIV